MLRGPVEVRDQGSNLISFETSQGVSGGVVDIEVAQLESGAGRAGKSKVGRHRSCVVGPALGTV